MSLGRIFILSLALTTSLGANAKSCQEAITEVYQNLGATVTQEDFERLSFEDLNVSIEVFNQLSPDVQTAIYQKMMPLEVIVDDMIEMLNERIMAVSGTMFEFMYLNQLEAWRTNRDLLRSCQYL